MSNENPNALTAAPEFEPLVSSSTQGSGGEANTGFSIRCTQTASDFRKWLCSESNRVNCQSPTPCRFTAWAKSRSRARE